MKTPMKKLMLAAVASAIRAASLAFAALLCMTQSASAFSGSGTSDDPYLIASTSDWNTLASNVNNGNSYSGKYFRLTNNISVTTMVGNNESNNSFSGTFDGYGYTLTATLSAQDVVAPFACINSATIKNLKVSGSITVSRWFGAGIVASVSGSSTLQNCLCNATITSTHVSGSNTSSGGIVGQVPGNLTVSGCAFTGSIKYTNGAHHGGGFIGQMKDNSSATITNSLFAPTSVTGVSSFYMFASGNSDTSVAKATIQNSYYNSTAASASGITVQGKRYRTITAGTDVTISGLGAATGTYNVSGITAYSHGIKYNGVYYAGNGDAVSLTLSHGSKTGYTFNRYTVSSGSLSNPTTSSPTLTMPDGNVTINATWTANTYTVTLDKQSGTGGSNSVTATYDSAMPSATMPTRTGYTFNGYYDATSGGTQYYTANGASARTWNKTSNATLYAQWRQLVPEFTINANGVLTGVNLNGATEVVIPDSVTSIGYMAFYGCSGLTSVTIPNSVTNIGNSAFYECSDLASMTIPNSVTSFGDYAFYGCSGLTSVTIPNSVTSIGTQAFFNCSGLTSVTIPNSVTNIERSVFYNCSGLKSITIPDSVTSFGDYALYGCSGLTSVSIPNGVTSIGRAAFYQCSGLTSVTIPDSLTSIGRSAFNRCSGLTSVTIPNSVTNIERSAFYDCSGLTSVTIPNSVTDIGDHAFECCSAMTNVVFMGDAPDVGSDAFSGVASGCIATVLPKSTGWGVEAGETWNGLILQYYNPYARFDETGGDSNWTVEAEGSWKSGVISHSQNTWAEVSVQGPCTVSFEWKVSSEGNWDKLHVYLDGGSTDKVPAISGEVDWTQTSFGIDDSAEHTVRWTYTKDGSVSSGSDCGWVRNVSVEAFVPESMFTINSNGVLTRVNLHEATEVVIPDNVTSIGASVFENCGGLTSVTIPNSVTNIGEKAFLRCRDLTSITIPDSVTNIGGFAFYECTGSTSLSIGNGVTSIGEKAFYGCSGVTSLTIPESVTTIGDQAFGHCYGLTSLTIPDSVTSIGRYAFFYCTGLESVTIGNGLTVIASSAFSTCTSLTSVTIPDSVTDLGEYAFDECSSLTSVTIPASVTIIRDRAFYKCSALTNVVFMGNAPTISPWTYDGQIHVFEGVASGCVASVSPESTGWGVEVGETWNGLILQYWPKESGYDAWAGENGITGAMDATSDGVYNVFRYVFDVPSGAFEETPLIDIAFVDGKVVVKTPPVVNSDGVTVSVVESSDVAGETITDTKELTEEGRAEFTKDSAAESRFYRLKAEVTE